jgi:predicted transcriptional regulator
MTDAVLRRGVPPPELLHRSDGVPLLYRAKVHWFQGESESYKSWAAQIAVADCLKAEMKALYVDFEDDQNSVAARLIALGVPAESIANPERFVYVRPDEPLRDRNGIPLPGSTDFDPILREPFDIAIIDGVTEAMTTEGFSLMDNADIAKWMRLLPKRIADRTGAAVISIDHVVKNKDAQGRYALGGQHKLAGVTGATYRFTTTRQLGRATTKPITGSVMITVEKDRPGWVRGRQSGDGRIAVLEITSWPDDTVDARLLPPDEARTPPPWDLCREILELLRAYPGLSKTRIETELDGKAATIREALKWLTGQGWVSVTQSGQTHRHTITAEGADALRENEND